MKKEIGFISPYPEMTRTANEMIQKEYGEIGVTTATLAKGVEEAKKLEEVEAADSVPDEVDSVPDHVTERVIQQVVNEAHTHDW